MPELMLRYRSATLFARLYAPEITMGIQTTEEVLEMGPEGNSHTKGPIFEPGPPKRKCKPKSRVGAGPKDEVVVKPPHEAVTTGHEISQEPASETMGGLGLTTAASVVSATKPQVGQYNYLKVLTGLVGLSKHSEAEVLTFLRNTQRCDESFATLAQVGHQQPGTIVWTHDNWTAVDREIARLKKHEAV
jgi:hypothetical protein